jgi:hypothetical protein
MRILIAVLVTLIIAHLTPVQAQINNSEPTPAPTETVEQPVTTEIPTTPVEPVTEPVVPTVEVQVQETPLYAPMTDNEAKNYIYMHESSMRLDAVNPIGACGLGQSLPCSKLESACPDWRTNYECQDAWFSNYAISRYGSWANAYNFWLRNRWW